ncbi:E3.2.1.4 [Mytilus coruscus]|uniref:cellulase n=1 Tax=Mytilus coruscus TaxID=42192 RepID=A0A6J8A8Z9_MYTCO|nr:E3.2.1.4 [Mytilus coruscus]
MEYVKYSSNETVHYLVNKDHSGIQTNNQQFDVMIEGTAKDGSVPSAQAFLQNMVHDNYNVPTPPNTGDHVKFGFPQASAVTLLTWSLLQYKDAYKASGQLDDMYDCIRWPLEWLLKCPNAVPYTPKGLAFRTKWGSLRHAGVQAVLVTFEDTLSEFSIIDTGYGFLLI